MVHALNPFNPNIQEAQIGRSLRVGDQTGLQSEFQDCQGYMVKSYLKPFSSKKRRLRFKLYPYRRYMT